MNGSRDNVWHTLGGALSSPSQLRKGKAFIVLPNARRGTAYISNDLRHRMECEAYAKKVRVCYA
jgi:hypothetical protein